MYEQPVILRPSWQSMRAIMPAVYDEGRRTSSPSCGKAATCLTMATASRVEYGVREATALCEQEIRRGGQDRTWGQDQTLGARDQTWGQEIRRGAQRSDVGGKIRRGAQRSDVGRRDQTWGAEIRRNGSIHCGRPCRWRQL
eukprot:5843878-Prymnesium_polylepis.4